MDNNNSIYRKETQELLNKMNEQYAYYKQQCSYAEFQSRMKETGSLLFQTTKDVGMLTLDYTVRSFYFTRDAAYKLYDIYKK